MEPIKKYECLADKELGFDLKGTSEYGAYWMIKRTKCPWPGKCLHWEHCNAETMNRLTTTLPDIMKAIVSVGNLLADGLIFTDNSFEAIIKGLQIIQKQKEGEGSSNQTANLDILSNKIEKLEQTIQENQRKSWEELAQLNNTIEKLSIKEIEKFDQLRMQNEELIKKINEINISKLEEAIHELNNKIPNLEPVFDRFKKITETLNAIGNAIGYAQ